jgi:hypothetical protein
MVPVLLAPPPCAMAAAGHTTINSNATTPQSTRFIARSS